MPKAVYRKYENQIVQKTQFYWTFSYSGISAWGGGYLGTTLDPDTGIVTNGTYYQAKDISLYAEPFSMNGNSKLVPNGYSSDKSRINGDVYNANKNTRQVDTDTKGAYLADVILELGSVPENGRHTDGYWYEYVRPACEARVRTDGIWRDAPAGYVNAGGIFRPVTEAKMNVNGIWKG